jgi:hypothetical protein
MYTERTGLGNHFRAGTWIKNATYMPSNAHSHDSLPEAWVLTHVTKNTSVYQIVCVHMYRHGWGALGWSKADCMAWTRYVSRLYPTHAHVSKPVGCQRTWILAEKHTHIHTYICVRIYA